MVHAVYIVEDHAVMRQGYALLIGRQPDLDVCGQTSSARQALHEIPKIGPDLVIADLTLDDMNGLEMIKRIRGVTPDVPVLVVSAHEEAHYAERAHRAGANGYIMKTAPTAKLLDAIRTILSGKAYVGEHLARKLLAQRLARPEDAATAAPDTSPSDLLTDRELEVFEHFGRGLKRSQIAEAMTISPKTVDTYRERLKAKLGADSSAQLLRRAALWVEQGRL
jgi:DNA-binding NarL/FixJ family response regulator